MHDLFLILAEHIQRNIQCGIVSRFHVPGRPLVYRLCRRVLLSAGLCRRICFAWPHRFRDEGKIKRQVRVRGDVLGHTSFGFSFEVCPARKVLAATGLCFSIESTQTYSPALTVISSEEGPLCKISFQPLNWFIKCSNIPLKNNKIVRKIVSCCIILLSEFSVSLRYIDYPCILTMNSEEYQ